MTRHTSRLIYRLRLIMARGNCALRGTTNDERLKPSYLQDILLLINSCNSVYYLIHIRRCFSKLTVERFACLAAR